MQKIYKYLDYIAYWSMVIIPFSMLIGPAMANIFLGLLLVSFLGKRVIDNKGISMRNALSMPFLLVFIISLISFKNTAYFGASMQGLVKLIKYWAIVLVCSQELKDIRHIKRIFISIVLGASLVSIDALWQIAFGRDFIRGNTLQSAIGLIRPTASFPNPNVMGIYLSAISPLIIGLAFFYYKAKSKGIMVCISILAACGVYSTLSRGSGLGFYFAFIFLSIAKKNRRIAASLILLFLIFPLVMPKNIKDWSKEIKYNPLVFLCNYDRLSMYKNALNMIRHHPFIGVGTNTFSKNYAKYKLPESENAKTPDTIYAHNSYLHMTGETGLLGLGVFLWLLFVLFKNCAHIYRRLKDQYLRIVLLSVSAGLFAFLINALTETSFYYPRVVIIFWYLAGLALAFRKFVPSEAK